MAYPDNLFDQDELEPDQYGGRVDNTDLDFEAWTWITGLVRSISARFLSHVRVPWVNSVVVVQNGCGIGDVLAIDLSKDFIDPTTQVVGPYIDKWSTILAGGGTPEVYGVAVSQAAALAKAQVATGGMIPPSISGLTAMSAGQDVAVDATTNKLRAWTSSDDSLGRASPKGSVFLKFSGRIAG